jgi:hypothetical protein
MCSVPLSLKQLSLPPAAITEAVQRVAGCGLLSTPVATPAHAVDNELAAPAPQDVAIIPGKHKWPLYAEKARRKKAKERDAKKQRSQPGY